MGAVLQELEKSTGLLDVAKAGQSKCFLCRYIVEDLEQRKKLTGHPFDYNGKGDFPVDGKLVHVILEIGEIPPEDSEDLEALAQFVLRLLATPSRSN